MCIFLSHVSLCTFMYNKVKQTAFFKYVVQQLMVIQVWPEKNW